MSGNMPAQHTAKMVIASAKRLMELRHVCLNSSRIAEISVPAWPIPIHHTKLMMANPHAPGMVTPQMPTPFRNSQVSAITRKRGHAAGDREPAEPAQRRVRRQHDARDLLRHRLEVVARRDDRVLARARVDHRVQTTRVSWGISSPYYASSGLGLMTPAV